MTTSSYKKAFKQLKAKPVKLRKYIKFNSPKERSCGINRVSCRRCGRKGGHIKSYGLNLCRHCFREISTKIGFKQYS